MKIQSQKISARLLTVLQSCHGRSPPVSSLKWAFMTFNIIVNEAKLDHKQTILETLTSEKDEKHLKKNLMLFKDKVKMVTSGQITESITWSNKKEHKEVNNNDGTFYFNLIINANPNSLACFTNALPCLKNRCFSSNQTSPAQKF